MKIELDENLPTALADGLVRLGHDVDTVQQERLYGRDDATIWQAAQQGQRFLITQDLDFSDIRAFRPGTHNGLLLVRLHQPGRTALRQHILNAFQSSTPDDWRGCFVVLTEHKVRIRRPSASRARERSASYQTRHKPGVKVLGSSRPSH